MQEKMDIRIRIDRLRDDRKLSLAQLAAKIEVADTTAYSWFKRNYYTPSRKTVEKFCEVFDITMAEFYSGVDLNKIEGEEATLLNAYRNVTDKHKGIVLKIIKLFQNKE